MKLVVARAEPFNIGRKNETGEHWMSVIAKYTKALAPALIVLATPAAAENLIKNGSFEKPVVRKGSFRTFPTGNGINNWIVSSTDSRNVAIVSGTFQIEDYRFPAKDGAQWFDLTGDGSGRGNYISQSVTTKIGSTYRLSFSVGNISGDGFGTSSTVEAYVNTQVSLSAQNRTQTKKLTWQTFTATFKADSNKTTIVFSNIDPETDNINALDDVSLELAPID